MYPHFRHFKLVVSCKHQMKIKQYIKEKNLAHYQSVMALGCLVILILMLVLAAINYYNISLLKNSLNYIVDDNNTKTKLTYQLRSLARERLTLLHQIVEENDSSALDELITKYNKLVGNSLQNGSSRQQYLKSSDESGLINKSKASASRVQPLNDKDVKLVNEKNIVEAKNILSQALNVQQAAITQLD